MVGGGGGGGGRRRGGGGGTGDWDFLGFVVCVCARACVRVCVYARARRVFQSYATKTRGRFVATKVDFAAAKLPPISETDRQSKIVDWK